MAKSYLAQYRHAVRAASAVTTATIDKNETGYAVVVAQTCKRTKQTFRVGASARNHREAARLALQGIESMRG